MTPKQRAEFERRIIQRAFEAGVVGCDVDAVLCNIAEEMKLGDALDYSAWEPVFWSLVERRILREEGVIPADFLALSYEEWGVRLQARAIELLRIALSGGTEDLPLAAEFATMLRGKVAT